MILLTLITIFILYILLISFYSTVKDSKTLKKKELLNSFNFNFVIRFFPGFQKLNYYYINLLFFLLILNFLFVSLPEFLNFFFSNLFKTAYCMDTETFMMEREIEKIFSIDDNYIPELINQINLPINDEELFRRMEDGDFDHISSVAAASLDDVNSDGNNRDNSSEQEDYSSGRRLFDMSLDVKFTLKSESYPFKQLTILNSDYVSLKYIDVEKTISILDKIGEECDLIHELDNSLANLLTLTGFEDLGIDIEDIEEVLVEVKNITLERLKLVSLGSEKVNNCLISLDSERFKYNNCLYSFEKSQNFGSNLSACVCKILLNFLSSDSFRILFNPNIDQNGNVLNFFDKSLYTMNLLEMRLNMLNNIIHFLDQNPDINIHDYIQNLFNLQTQFNSDLERISENHVSSVRDGINSISNKINTLNNSRYFLINDNTFDVRIKINSIFADYSTSHSNALLNLCKERNITFSLEQEVKTENSSIVVSSSVIQNSTVIDNFDEDSSTENQNFSNLRIRERPDNFENNSIIKRRRLD